MPPLSTLWIFLAAALVLLVIPGPAVLYIVTRSAAHGRRAGLASVLGVEVGSLIHSMAAAFGLSAILMTSALAFQVVKYAGAAYLVYLGIRALLSRGDNSSEAAPAPAGGLQLFARGFLVNLLNPKTALFFYAFLPQFVDPSRGAVQGQIFLLGMMFVALATCTDSLYALLASSVGGWLFRKSGFRRARRYITGSIYIALGITAAFSGLEKK
ncbi:MAG TPA: LysE family translocator [Spirochaetia bacterium]|nr:LysE family translocator [Spirochaetia bacterium]